jgi:[ribosomal protein S18]-alanine N-acetyltransferase
LTLVLIRPATADDVPLMHALEQQSEGAAHWARREYDALFASDTPPRVALVAVSESAVTQLYGFVIARCAAGDWEIENVVVAGENRRLGIGTKLMRDLLAQVHVGGATSVLLEVRESNLAARRLYEKLGFSQQGRRKNYYSEPTEDALLLRISIAFP